MERLKEDYKGDILDVSMNGRRQYEEVENANGTKSMIDRTVYAHLGDEFGPEDFYTLYFCISFETVPCFML